MIEEQFFSSSEIVDVDAQNILIVSNKCPSHFVSQWLNKTVIKLKNDIVLDRVSQQSLPLSSTLVEAMQRLVLIIAKLRSPDSGWPNEVPFSAEHLLPYVSEEAYEVYEAFQAELSSTQPNTAHAIEIINFNDYSYSISCKSAHFITNLIPQLLWYLASRSEAILLLLTGVKCQVSQHPDSWRTGELRLVASLNIKTEQGSQLIDLATQQSPQSELAADSLIQSKDYSLFHHPKTCYTLLQELQKQILETSIPINILNADQPIELLTSGQAWQQGALKLQLSLEFIQTSEVEPIQHLESAENLGLNSNFLENLNSDNSPIIQFIEPAFRTIYFQIPIQKQLLFLTQSHQREYQQNSHEIPSLQEDNLDEFSLGLSEIEGTPPLINHFIDSASSQAESIFGQTVSLSSNQVQPQTLLLTLTQKLLWHTISSSYQVMQLIAGIQAKVLQPGDEWQIGTLRLIVLFNINLPQQSWTIDIATNQFLQMNTKQIEETAIIQSNQFDWCHSPIEAQVLIDKVINQISTTSTELKLWMDGAAIQWQDSPLNSESLKPDGHAHISVRFEWMSQKSLLLLKSE